MQEGKKGMLSKLALLTAAVIWGSTFVIIKNTVDVFPPNFLLAFRFTIAFLLFIVIFHKKLRNIRKGMVWRGAGVGLCLFLAYSLQTVGMTDTSPGKNAFLTAIYCVIVPFLFWIVNHTRPNRYHIAAGILGLAGIGLISLTDSFTIGFGDGITLLSGFFYAAHMVAVAKCSKSIDPVILTVLQFGFAAMFSWIAGLGFETLPAAWPADAVWSVLYLAVVATAGGLFLQNIGQARTHPSSAALILSLESVFGVLFSILFYGEVITGRMAAGFVCIFLAIVVSETRLSFLTNRLPLRTKAKKSQEILNK